MTTKEELLNHPLRFLSYVFNHPFETKRKPQIISGCIFWLMVMYHSWYIVKNFWYINGNLPKLAKTVESISTYCQIHTKLIALVIYRNDLKDLLILRKQLWDIPPKLKHIRKIYFYGVLWNKIYTFTIYALLVGLYLKPLFGENLLLALYVPNNPYEHGFLLAGQYIIGFYIGTIVIGGDCLFVSLCIDATVQFKILNYHLEKLNVTDGDEYLIQCIRQHTLLIRYFKGIRKFYTLSILHVYFMVIGTACLELYVITESEADSRNFLLGVLYMCCLFNQLSTYCFAATYLSTESTLSFMALYMSKWYMGSNRIQKLILIFFMKLKVEYTIKAGGMINVNLQSFVEIIKTTFSFLTIIRKPKE